MPNITQIQAFRPNFIFFLKNRCLKGPGEAFLLRFESPNTSSLNGSANELLRGPTSKLWTVSKFASQSLPLLRDGSADALLQESLNPSATHKGNEASDHAVLLQLFNESGACHYLL